MNLDQLRAFQVVAECGTISRATSVLALSQSAVSRQLQALEAELASQLFSRDGRAMVLTEAGRVLLNHARTVLGSVNRAREAVAALKGLERGHLRVGAASTIGTYLLPPALGTFKQAYPGIDLTLEVANKAHILDRLLRGDIELGFAGPRLSLDDLLQSEYLQDELGLITAPSHPLARARRVCVGDVVSEVFIIRERGSGTREIVEEELRRAGVELSRVMEIGSTEAIKQAVAANLGVSIVSRYAVRLETASGLLAFAPVEDLKLVRPLYVLHHRRRPLTQAATAFLELLQRPPAVGSVRAVTARATRSTGRQRSL
jgi:DNA-binding transcriptional LysR family regulator